MSSLRLDKNGVCQCPACQRRVTLRMLEFDKADGYGRAALLNSWRAADGGDKAPVTKGDVEAILRRGDTENDTVPAHAFFASFIGVTIMVALFMLYLVSL